MQYKLKSIKSFRLTLNQKNMLVFFYLKSCVRSSKIVSFYCNVYFYELGILTLTKKCIKLYINLINFQR